MDLTQGYHQAPLSNTTKAYTAFITFSGVYEFTRLPFGPKRAPSFFQEIKATVVLVGLICMNCEMYIDDCSVFGDTNIEFVSRLRLVFERFRKHTQPGPVEEKVQLWGGELNFFFNSRVDYVKIM